MQVWLKEKLFIKSELKKNLIKIQKNFVDDQNFELPEILYTEHHQAHGQLHFIQVLLKRL